MKPRYVFLCVFTLFIFLYIGLFKLDAADKESIPIPFSHEFVTYEIDANNTSSDAVNETTGNQRFQKSENKRTKNLITYQMIFTTLALAFGLVHLILFLFFKKARENLYFAIFLFFYAASIFFDYQNTLYAGIDQTMVYIRIHRAIQPFYLLFALRFVYSLFYPRVLKRFWFFVPLLFIFGLYSVFSPHGDAGYQYFGWATIPLSIEMIRVIVNALLKKRQGAWIIATGFFIYYFFTTFDTLMDLGINVPFIEMENPYAFGTVGFLVTMSVYLARNYSNTYQKMLEKERQVSEKEITQNLLEVENARKTKELEEARKLQLSMLPECISELPGIDICFYMEPATEVGGDYYDYLIDKDGSLILVVGDATGHGMKAGIMVATIKSLFQSSGTHPDISSFFNQCTNIIKKMNMGNLYMALALCRLKDNKLTAASAGMPHVLIYREAEQIIDEIKTKGPPLGGFSGYSYQQKETKLNRGDTVLLMSDGFPEQFNEKDEMMGYERVKEILSEVANQTPAEIANHLIDESIKWRNLKAQDDDITFVVLKVKQRNEKSSHAV
jgi:serine phosphatase RsbU (regulator of sigma subunit)